MRLKLRLGGLIIPASMLLASCGQINTVEPKASTAVEVQTITPEPWSRTVSLTGEIQARVQSDVAFRTSGRIEQRVVDVGDHVTAGQELARLEPTLQIADVQSGRAGVEAARAQLEKAKADFHRQQALIDKGFARRSTFDDARAALVSAEATLQRATAISETAADSREQTVLVASTSGIITARKAEVGQVVAAAQPIFTIAHDGHRDAAFDLYEELITNKASPIIHIELLSDRNVEATGRVREVAPVIDPQTNTVRVKVGLQDAPPKMTLGAAVAGTGRYPPRNVVVLPWTALVNIDDQPSVWVVDRDAQTVSSRVVQIAAYRTGKILVNQGLKAGELVVTAGGQLLWPGKRVEPKYTVSRATLENQSALERQR